MVKKLDVRKDVSQTFFGIRMLKDAVSYESLDWVGRLSSWQNMWYSFRKETNISSKAMMNGYLFRFPLLHQFL